MSWGAIAGAAIGAGVSYLGAKESNKQTGKGGGGTVNMHTVQDPWAPSALPRMKAMDRVSDLLNLNGGAPPMDGQIPAPVAGGKKGKKGKGGKGAKASPAAPAAPKFNGVSQETDLIRQNLIKNAEQGDPLYGQASDYIGNTLSGDPSRDTNPYRTETAGYLRDVTEDPDLRRFKDMLFGGISPGSSAPAKGTSRGGGSGGRYVTHGYATIDPTTGQQLSKAEVRQRLASSSGGSSGVPGQTRTEADPYGQGEGAGPVGIVDDLQAILGGKYLNEKNPYFDSVIAETEAQANKAYDERAKALRLRAAGGGMYGGTPYQQAESSALSEYGTGLARATGSLRAQEYESRMADVMQAAGLGAGYDTAALDRLAQERMAKANREAAERSASAGAGAASAAADADREARLEIARMGALGDAIGMGADLSKFQASGFGGLADLYSGDQRFALGAVPDISGLDLRDWGAAGELSLGADAGRTKWAGDRGSEATARAGIGVQRAGLDFDKYRYNREIPLRDLALGMDIINASSGGYGTTAQWGTDTRGGGGSTPQVNPWMQAIAGGAAGYQFGSQFGGGGGAPAAGGGGTGTYDPRNYR